MKATSTMDFTTIGITVLVTDLSLVVSLFLLRNRIFGQITQFINGYIGATIENIVKNPEMIAPLVKILTDTGMKSMGIDKEKSLPALKIGGLKIPGYIVQAAMPFLQAQLQKGLPGMAEKVAENALA